MTRTKKTRFMNIQKVAVLSKTVNGISAIELPDSIMLYVAVIDNRLLASSFSPVLAKTVDRVNLVLGADIQYQNVYKGLKRERFDYYDTIFMGANIRFQRVSFDALSVLTS